MASIEIRDLCRDDFDCGFLETLNALTEVGLTASQARVVFDRMPANQSTFVAVQNGRVVATTTVLIDHKYIHAGGKVGHIEDVAVSKVAQGSGIGSQLVNHAVAFARQSGCYKVILDCHADLRPFYHRLGFRDFNFGLRLDLSDNH